MPSMTSSNHNRRSTYDRLGIRASSNRSDTGGSEYPPHGNTMTDGGCRQMSHHHEENLTREEEEAMARHAPATERLGEEEGNSLPQVEERDSQGASLNQDD
ncbi:hypothetical protein R1flu_008059 [Riccia fluitans]|uniref:Uncharacterized protein n=1 Tax=Riccia fluitans TaxID=41844 RepID=A0ABD1YBM6_9MARC